MIKLYPKQQEIFDITWDHWAWAWFHETGTGKTYFTLNNIEILYLKKHITAAIIVAPITVLKRVWLTKLDEYYTTMPFYVFTWISDMSEDQKRKLSKLLKDDRNPPVLPIFLINIEAFSHNRVYEMLNKILRKWKIFWAIDQSTTIRNPTVKRTKGILSVSHFADYKRILSGYPVLKSPENLYTQIQFLGPNLIPHRSFYAFRNDFCLTRQLDNRVTITTGTKNTEKLSALIQPFSSRLYKKDIADLPPKTRTIRSVEMTKDQFEYYETMRKKGYIEVKNSDKQIFAKTLLTQLDKLHQIANGIIISEDIYLDCNKYQILVDFIKEEIPNQQCIIWCSYVNNIWAADMYLTKAGISTGRIFGEVSLTERDKYLNLYAKGQIQVMIMNPAVAKFGLNDFADTQYAIYFSNSFNLEDRLESEDRIQRIGQTHRNILYIDLITEGTNEIKILETLEQQHSVGAEILRDKWESWFN